MIQPDHLLQDVIRPALAVIGLQSVAAEQLLLGTAAAESRLGTYLHQLGGPALGVWQIEPATHEDVWLNVLAYKQGLRGLVLQLAPPIYVTAPEYAPLPRVLCGNLLYACAIARIVYWRHKDPLPEAGDWKGIAAYWKRAYNTPLGAGTVEHFLDACDACGVLGQWSGTSR